MDKVVCAKCNNEMVQAWQGKVYETDTFRFQCPKCGGVSNIQKKGRKVRQIQLNGNHDEYRPTAFQPEDEVELEEPAAFTVGLELTPEEQQAMARARANGAAAQNAAWSNFQQAQAQAAAQARAGVPQAVWVQAQAAAAAMAAAAAQQGAAAARAQQLHMLQLRAAQRAGRPMPPIQQPVAHTLGAHPNPVLPPPPAALRRRLLGQNPPPNRPPF